MTDSQVSAIRAAPLPRLAEIYRRVWEANDRDVVRDFILNDRFFLLTQVLGVAVAWHPWVYARCREVEADPDERLDLWSRGHFKSTIITFAGVVQEVLRNPEVCVCIISYKADAAEAFAGQIKGAFEANETLLRCFPDVLWTDRPDHRGDQWSVGDFCVRRKTTKKESTVATSGLVSGMRTGGHYDILVYDDVVTPDSVITAEMRERTTAAWSMSLNLGVTSGTRHWYIGTRYHMFDTYAEMIRRGIPERRHVCIDARGEPVLLPRAELERKRREMSTADWNSQMMQTPIGAGELLFRPEWIRTFDRPPSIPMNVYVVADTAQKQRKSSDYTVFWVIGLGADRRTYLLDCVRDKLPQSGRCDRLFGLVEKWMPICVFYEENAAPDDPSYIEARMAERGRFTLVPFRQTPADGAKATRIETLEPEFREGLVWMPSALRYRQFDGTWRDLMHDFQAEELLVYPQVTHDDMLDALASKNHADVRPRLSFPTFRQPPALAAPERERVLRRRDDRLFAR